MAQDQSVFRQITHPIAQSTLKTECYKLADFTKIMHDFLQSLSHIYETAGSAIQKLVEENKKKITEINKENFQYNHTTLTTWRQLLDNWKTEGESHCTFARDIKTETVNTLHDQRSHFKESIKRIYNYRDTLNNTVTGECEQRDKLQKDYSSSWSKYKSQLNTGTTKKVSVMPTYTAYNNYLLQLCNSNGAAHCLLDKQMPNLMQELEAIQHNLHNCLFTVLQYTFDSQAHHYTECLNIANSAIETVRTISPADDVLQLGESQVLPPEVYSLYLEKEFLPADTIDSGIPAEISNGYMAREEYTMHTLGKKYRKIRQELNHLDTDIAKGNKDLDALSKLLATYQETPTYGKSTDIEVKMSNLRQELRLLEMNKAGFTCQLGLLEESGISLDNSCSIPSDDDNKSIISGILGQGEHEWAQLSKTEMKSCDHCQRPVVLQKSYQCTKCKLNCHGACRNKVFDCVGQPLVEQTAGKVNKIKDTIIKGGAGFFRRGSEIKKYNDGIEVCTVADDEICAVTMDLQNESSQDGTLGREWWTLKGGPPDLQKFASEEDIANELDEDVYDTIEDYKSDNDLDREETFKAPPIIRQSDQIQQSEQIRQSEQIQQSEQNRPPLAPPEPPHLKRTSLPLEDRLLARYPPVPGAVNVSVALFEYKDIETSSEAWCAPGFRVDVLQYSNEDWCEGICNGKQGYFPVSYLEPVPQTGAVLRCLYDFQATDKTEMSIGAGQVVFKVEDQGNGWIYGRFKNQRGVFPASYVHELEEFH